MTVHTTRNHKEAAVDFMRLIGSGEIREAFQRYAAPNFRHHNPHFRGDAESLQVAMLENAAQNPRKVVEVLRAIHEGDLVAVHSRVQHGADDRGAALIHIFRFEGDRVAELWDIAQLVPENSPNEYGVF